MTEQANAENREAHRVRADKLHALIAAVLRSFEVPDHDAETVAEVLVAADLYGIDSHGVARLVYYVAKLRAGLINPHPDIRARETSAVACVIDGDNGLGQVVGRFAMDHCIDQARESTAACVSVCHSNHFGIAGYFARRAVEHGMIGVAMTNAIPFVVPTFGREPRLGTNPIAVAVPTGTEHPLLVDMATSAVSVGKLQLAMGAGEAIPEGWAIDTDGNPSTDPIAGLQGGLLPLGSSREMGSHKGYGFAVLVDVFSALLSGAAYGTQCGGLTQDITERSNVGHFFAAISVDAFRPLSEFRHAMDDMIQNLKDTPPTSGQDRVYVHGEPEFEKEPQRRRDGIPLDTQVVNVLRQIADSAALSDRFDEMMSAQP